MTLSYRDRSAAGSFGSLLVVRLLLGLISLSAAAGLAGRSPASVVAAPVQQNQVVAVSAASFDLGPLAPDAIAAAFGTVLATRVEASTATPLPTALAGTTLKVRDSQGTERFAQLFFVAPSQINFLVPAGTATGEALLTVTNGNGVVSIGRVQIARVAPGLFTVNAGGTGLPAAFALRVAAGGAQTSQQISRFDPNQNRFVPVPVDLGGPTDQIFLILFGTGIRGRNGLADVSVRLGGLEAGMPVGFAGPVQGLAGLDQLNVGPINRADVRTRLAGRGLVNLSLSVVDAGSNVAKPSNVAELEVVNSATPALTVSEPPPITFLAGQTLTINGGPFVTGNLTDNRVRIGSLPAQVVSATASALSVVVPFGAQTGQVSVSTPSGERTTNESLLISTSVSGLIETSDRQPLPNVAVRVVGATDQTMARADGTFVLPITVNSPSNSAVVVLQVSPQTARGFENYGTLLRRIEIATKRDNRLPAPLSLQLPDGRAASVNSGEIALDIPVFSCGDGVDPQIPGTAAFRLPAGTTAQFPAGINTNQVILSQVQNCRTPLRLPLRLFSPRIVQLTPLGTRFSVGGQLTFPNSDNHTPGTEFSLFQLDQRRDGSTLGDFVYIGNAAVSADRRRIETLPQAIIEAGIYFLAPPPRALTAVTGRVVEVAAGLGETPVQGAFVTVRGQSTFTDGDGSFVLLNVPVADNGDAFIVEVNNFRADGRADSVQRPMSGAALRPGGVTFVTPNIVLATITPSSNRPPIANTATITLDEDTTRVITLSAGDPDGNPLRYTFTQTSHGRLAGAPPYLVYTPEPNYNGPDNFTFKVNDGKADSNTAVVAITVNPVNDPPVITVPGTQTVKENENLTFTITVTDPDIGQIVTVSAPSLPGGASFIESAKRFTWTPGCTQAGTFVATFVAVDNGPNPLSDVKSVTINVIDDNCAPILNLPAQQNVNEGQTLTFSVSASDPDPGQTVTLSVANLPRGAIFTPTNGQFVWTPDCTQAGGYLLTFTATDNGTPQRSAARTLSIVVNNVNVPPTITAPDAFSIAEGQPLTFTVSAAPSCPNQTIQINNSQLPAGAGFGLPSNTGGVVSRQFFWTPTFTQAGRYQITFTAVDLSDQAATASRVVTVNVVDFNRDPELNVPAPLNATVGQQINFTITGNDPDPGQSVTLSSPNLPQGAVFNTSAGNPVIGNFSWTPNFAQLGTFMINFVVTDNGAPVRTATKQVTIIVGGDCDPVLNVPGPQTVVECLSLTFSILTAPRCPGQTATLSSTSLPPRATFNTQTGQFSWTPNIGEAGTHTASFSATDNSTPARVVTRSVTITVLPNRPPAATPQDVTVDEDTARQITLAGTDPENQPLSFTIVTPPLRGTLTGTPPTLTYTPVSNYNGTDSFTFRANDGKLTSATATVSITVRPVNDVPTANSQTLATSEDTPLAVTLQANDPDGDSLTYTITRQPTNGTLSGIAPNLIYTPAANFAGADEIRFRVNDGTANSNEAVISIMITQVNDPPTLVVPGPQTVFTGAALNFNVTATDPDAGQAVTISATGLPSGATFTQTNPTTGQFTWTPLEAQVGNYIVTFTAADNGLPVLSSTRQVAIVVNPVTTTIVIDAPMEVTVPENQATSFVVSATGGTAGQQFVLTATNLPSGANFPSATSQSNSVSQTFTWTPNFTQSGTYDVIFSVTRGSATLSKTTRINVTNLCRPPALTVPTAQIIGTEGQAITFSVSGTDPDIGETLTLTSPNLPVGATFPPATSTSGTVSQTFNWTPAFNQAGTYTVNFTLTDNCTPTSQSDTRSVVIVVGDVNRAPVARALTGDQKVLTPEDLAKQITLTGTDEDGDVLTFTVVTQPARGSLSGTAPNLIYTPQANFNGSDSFTFKVSDGRLESPSAVVEIQITPECDPPVLTVPGAQTATLTVPADCNTPITGTPLTFNVTVVDPDTADTVTLTATGLPPGATFTQNGTTGTFNWTPNPFTEPSNFVVTFIATDNCTTVQTATATVTINFTIPPAVQRWQATGMPRAGTVITLLTRGPDIFAAALGGGVFRTSNNGQTWPRVDVAGLTSSDVRALVVKNTATGPLLFAGTPNGGVFRSNDNGANWVAVNTGLTQPFVRALAVAADGTVFAGTLGGGVFFTTNNGDVWQTLNNGLSDLQIYSLLATGTGVNARLYAGTDTAGVMMISTQGIPNTGSNWALAGSQLPQFRVNSIEISLDGMTLFAGLNGGGAHRLNLAGFGTWDSISIGLGSSTVNDLLVTSNRIYAATEQGISFSTDQGTTWGSLNECLPLFNIQSLTLNSAGTKLFAGSNEGRSFVRPL